MPGWFGSYTRMTMLVGVSSYPNASTWWFFVRAAGELSDERTSPTTDGWPLSSSARIAGHSLSTALTLAGSRPSVAATPVGGSPRSAWRSRNRRGTLNQSSDSTWRRTRASNRGEPLAGGVVSGGDGTPASNRSRAVSAMPPHRPADASPKPRNRVSNGPKRTVGPGGNEFANLSP